MSKGVLQHDMWDVKAPSNRWDWDGLRARIAQHGVRNSLLLAPMPTASTSQVYSYCFRAETSPVPVCAGFERLRIFAILDIASFASLDRVLSCWE